MIGLKKRDIKKALKAGAKAGGVSLADVRADIEATIDEAMNLVSQQVQQMQEEEKNNEGKVSTEYVAPKQDVQSISVEVTPEMYLLDGVSVLVLITASVLVSGIVILKRNPKDILSEMS